MEINEQYAKQWKPMKTIEIMNTNEINENQQKSMETNGINRNQWMPQYGMGKAWKSMKSMEINEKHENQWKYENQCKSMKTMGANEQYGIQ